MVNYSNTHYDQESTVGNYDICRYIHPKVLSAFAGHLLDFTEASCKGNSGKILEEGSGNGRILMPVVHESVRRGRSDQFYAIDKSALILDDLAKKLDSEDNRSYLIWRADIQDKLPFLNNYFDCIYTFATYHILSDPIKALDHAIDALKESGYFVFGKEFNQVFHGTERKIEPADSPDFEGIILEPRIKDFFHKYHELRDRYEVPFIPSGALYSDPSLVLEHLKSKGLKHKIVGGAELEWMKPHTLRQMLEAFRLRNITTFGSEISDNIRMAMHKELLEWCNSKNIPLDEAIHIPARIRLHVFSR